MQRKVLIISNDDWSTYNFRMPLVRALSREGYDVVLVFPFGKYTERLRATGYRVINWDLDRGSFNPFKELRSIFQLIRIYRTEKPFLAHHYSIKSNIYGLFCKKLTGLENIMVTWTGLGFVFSDSVRAKWLRFFLLPVMRGILKSKDERHIFLNPEDRNQFLRYKLASYKKSAVILGEGVDTGRFCPGGEKEKPAVALLASRLLWDKGVGDLVDAARILRAEGVPVEIWIAGEQDRSNPSCIPDRVMEEWKTENIVRFLGRVDDMPALFGKASIAVLPSYMEGVSRFLLEAASAGLPLVAADIPGCRVVVKDGKNGYLVPVKRPDALAARIKDIIEDASKMKEMGRISREDVLAMFDERIVVGEFLELYRMFS